jgi:hypothetical protein
MKYYTISPSRYRVTWRHVSANTSCLRPTRRAASLLFVSTISREHCSARKLERSTCVVCLLLPCRASAGGPRAQGSKPVGSLSYRRREPISPVTSCHPCANDRRPNAHTRRARASTPTSRRLLALAARDDTVPAANVCAVPSALVGEPGRRDNPLPSDSTVRHIDPTHHGLVPAPAAYVCPAGSAAELPGITTRFSLQIREESWSTPTREAAIKLRRSHTMISPPALSCYRGAPVIDR